VAASVAAKHSNEKLEEMVDLLARGTLLWVAIGLYDASYD